MLRTGLSIVVGFAVWSVLWLVGNQVALVLFPSRFAEDGSTRDATVLMLVLGLSVVISLVAGYLTGLVARGREVAAAATLGVVLLAVGIAVQLQYWEAMPIWYHLSFLLLLVPAAWLGGRMRASQLPAG